MVLGITIQNRLAEVVENPQNLCYDFDIRYLGRWISKYPNVFPKFIREGNFEPKFVWNDKLKEFRWEIHKTK